VLCFILYILIILFSVFFFSFLGALLQSSRWKRISGMESENSSKRSIRGTKEEQERPANDRYVISHGPSF